MTGKSERLVEEYGSWMLDDLVAPQTLGRSFYMRPATKPQIADEEYVTNEAFWYDVRQERIGAERNVRLLDFNVFDWVPRNPGLFHERSAGRYRLEAGRYVRPMKADSFQQYVDADGAPPDGASQFRGATFSDGKRARTLIYTPQGKFSMLQGGVGCVRFKPLQLKVGGTAWLMSATSSRAPDEGIPILISNHEYQRLDDALRNNGGVRCDLVGRTRFVADQFRDLYSVRSGIPRLYVEVFSIEPKGVMKDRGQVSVAASFLSQFEGQPKIYASYVTFDPGLRGARRGAAQWLQEEYVEGLYAGSILTDFDQRAPVFANALFTLDQVLTSPDLAAQIHKLRSLYGNCVFR